MRINFRHINFLHLLAFAGTFFTQSCKKFVQIAPPNSSIAGVTVYSNNTSAAAVMTGLYSNMITNPGMASGNNSIGYLMGLAADELTNYDATNLVQVQFYENALSSNSNGTSNYYFWTELYRYIYIPNALLDGISSSNGLSTATREQLTGEAKFMRAFLNFYATNLYGNVPLVTTTNYLTNNSISQTPQAQVYQQITADLLDAQSKLSVGFVDELGNSAPDRIRPNQGAATAMLARVYLYTSKWDSAEAAATTLINNSPLYSLDSVNAVFLANSTETIWQLMPVYPGVNTWDAFQSYCLTSVPGPGGKSVAMDTFLTKSFEPGDERFTDWVGIFTADSIDYYYTPFKYKVSLYGQPLSEYTMVLRLAEQYLIRAEARAQQGNITGSSGALADLNAIRNRAGLPTYSGPIDQISVLAAILHERQVELFSEWGHRWFDLKRTNNLNLVMGSPGNVCQEKGGLWKSDWALLPIALQELQINPNLKQNQGYNN